MSQIHGLYGRNQPDLTKFMPRLEDYNTPGPMRVAAGLPNIPGTINIDRATDVPQWPMYLNDQLGDCTIAGMGHLFGAMSVYGGHPFALFNDSVIQSTYSAIGGYVPGQPNTDQGCAMPDVLKYMSSTGMTDEAGKTHKVAAWAAFGNPTDATLLSQVLAIFGGVYLGINCPQSAETEFDNHQVWTYVTNSPIAGGHAIAMHHRKPYGSQVGVFDFSTWGALQWATLSFISGYVEEAYVVITEDWIRTNGTSMFGLNLKQMLADMTYVK